MTRAYALTLAVLIAATFSAACLADGALPGELTSLIPTDVLKALVFWPKTVNEFAFLISGWAGVFLHYRKKVKRDGFTGSFLDYLEADNPKWSVATVIVIYVVIMALITMGLVQTAALPGVVIGGLFVGWVIDSYCTPKTQT